jgi:CTP:molybdopterin cytidylyltransferase MocA
MTSARPSIAIVPAAGRSERFGGIKLLADVNGQPLIARTLQSLLDAGIPRIIVVCAPMPFGSVELFDDVRVELATNPEPSRGMFSTIQSGLAFAGVDEIAVVLPADMPFVRPGSIAAVIDECRRTDAPIAAAFRGTAGHPLALPPRLRNAILAASSSKNLKDVLKSAGEAPVSLEVEDRGVIRDVDIQEDLLH